MSQLLLQAIGQRNLVENETENRENKRKALLAVIAEKQAELERANKQHQSLLQVESEQLKIIEKLSEGGAE